MRPMRNERTASPLFVVVLLLAFGFAFYWQVQWQKNIKKDPYKEIPGQVETISCTHCLTRGLVPDASPDAPPGSMLICPYCQGVGGHAIRKFDKLDKICPACSGLGRIADADTGEVRECRRCHGRGLIRPVDSPIVIQRSAPKEAVNSP